MTLRAPYLDDGDVRLYVGDCIEVMQEMEAESVDAVVCDPPYGLEFMGKEWDSFAPDTLVKRSGWDDAASGAAITKSGFTKLGKHGTPEYGKRRSTSKCSGCGKRDAFRNAHPCKPDARWEHEWVDSTPTNMLAYAAWCETWAREALRVLKPGGHLLAFGGTRTFHRLTCGIENAGFEVRDCLSWLYGSGFPKSLDVAKAIDKAAGAERTDRVVIHGGTNKVFQPSTRVVDKGTPTTDAAREWEGWGTALKPAWEPCVVARKPLVGTVAANVQQHGTGALNIDGCRIAGEVPQVTQGVNSNGSGYRVATVAQQSNPHAAGRWPANVAFDEAAAAMLDAQSGERGGGFGVRGAGSTDGRSSYALGGNGEVVGYGDTGGASRFFYTAKASRADRNAGGMAENTHPTVKPTDLMRWLVRLVTPPGGIVLDPFAGSGSTLVAARAEGARAVGIEREDEYARIIADRLAQLSLFSEGMDV
jgi:site-specific DNA-methyltransferase (adenine-specific)